MLVKCEMGIFAIFLLYVLGRNRVWGFNEYFSYVQIFHAFLKHIGCEPFVSGGCAREDGRYKTIMGNV